MDSVQRRNLARATSPLHFSMQSKGWKIIFLFSGRRGIVVDYISWLVALVAVIASDVGAVHAGGENWRKVGSSEEKLENLVSLVPMEPPLKIWA